MSLVVHIRDTATAVGFLLWAVAFGEADAMCVCVWGGLYPSHLLMESSDLAQIQVGYVMV